MATPKTEEKSLPTSPLLNAQPPKTRSTINLNKMEESKFTHRSETKSSETSSLRIIAYVAVVIVVGVGAALLARQLMSNNNTVVESEDTQEQETNTQPVSFATSSYLVDTMVKSDSSATNKPENSDFKTSSLLSLGTNNVNMVSASLDSISYSKYQTFARTTFVMSTTENKFPKTNISYDSAKDTLSLEIVGLANITSELKETKNINDIVETISFDESTGKFTLQFSQTSVYRVYAVEDTLFVDIRTEDEYTSQSNEETSTSNEDTDTSSQTETNTNTNSGSTTTTDSSKPTAPHYENDFSQNTQYVSSKVNTKSIALNNYYTWDEGTFFEFSWAEEDKKGDDYVPNAKAYLKEESGTNYLYIEIENLTRATLPGGITAEEIATKTSVNMAGANFVELSLVEFNQTTGKAIYKIELKKKANFQLLTQETYLGDTQILSVQIKD